MARVLSAARANEAPHDHRQADEPPAPLSRREALAGLRAAGTTLQRSSHELLVRLFEAVPPGPARQQLERQRLSLVLGPDQGFLASLVTDVGDIAMVLAGVGVSAGVLAYVLPAQGAWGRQAAQMLLSMLVPPVLVGVMGATWRIAAFGATKGAELGARLRQRRVERLFIHAIDLRWDRVLALLDDDRLRSHVPRLLAIALAYLPHLTAAAGHPALVDEHLAIIDRFSAQVGLPALPGLAAASDAVDRTIESAERKARVIAALLRISEQVDGSRGPMR
jgi:hypothetical protein